MKDFLLDVAVFVLWLLAVHGVAHLLGINFTPAEDFIVYLLAALRTDVNTVRRR